MTRNFFMILIYSLLSPAIHSFIESVCRLCMKKGKGSLTAHTEKKILQYIMVSEKKTISFSCTQAHTQIMYVWESKNDDDALMP